MKFEQKRMKTPSLVVLGLRAAVSHSKNFTEFPKILQTVCAGCKKLSDEMKQEIKSWIRNLEKDGGFDGVFSKRTQREIYSDHDQVLNRMSVCSDAKSLLLHKSTPNRTHIKITRRFSIKPQEKGKGETKSTRLQILARIQN